ncbi:MAG TPA: MFS transporter [Acidimicrobiales bacterium]|nr:MFS transporter [Acidimicrobiales bacterium]
MDRSAPLTLHPVVVASALVAGASMALFPLFPELQARHGISTASLGVIAAAGFLATLVAEVALAPLADRGRARHLLVGGAVALALSLGLIAVADDVWTLTLSRIVGGLGYGSWLPAASALVVRAAPARAGEQLGRLYAGELLGLAIGPLLAAVGFGVIDLVPTMAIGAAALLVAGVWAGRTTVPGIDHVPTTRPPRIAVDLLRSPAVRAAVLLTVAFWLPIGAYDAIWPRFIADLGASTALVGVSYTLFALPFVVVAPLAGRLSDRIGGARAAVRGFSVLLPVVLAFGFVGQLWVVLGLGVVESTGQAIASTGAAAAMAQAVSSERAGAGQGLARAAGTLAAALAALVAAPIYDSLGREVLFPATVAVVVVVVAAALLTGRRRPARSDAGVAGPPIGVVGPSWNSAPTPTTTVPPDPAPITMPPPGATGPPTSPVSSTGEPASSEG